MLKETRIAIVLVVAVLIALMYFLWPHTPSLDTSDQTVPSHTLNAPTTQPENATPKPIKPTDQTATDESTRIIVQPPHAQVDDIDLNQVLSGKVIQDDKVIPDTKGAQQP